MQITGRRLGDVTPGATDSTGGIDWSTLLPALVTGASNVYTQQQLLDYNKSAVANGLPVLSAAQIQSLVSSGTPGVNVGLTASTQSLMEYALGGAAALAVFYIFMRRAR
jgi:hypothetical protein